MPPSPMAVGATALALLAGCASLQPRLTPLEQANRHLREVCGDDFHPDPRIFAPATIARVEPLYTLFHIAGSFQSRAAGARIILRAEPGWTREWIDRNLDCHQARVLLKKDPPLPNDPYAVPGQWLSIDEESDTHDLVVLIHAETPEVAMQVLANARAFGGGH